MSIVHNLRNGEGSSPYGYQVKLRCPSTVRDLTLETLYTWSVAKTAVDIIPETILSLDWSFDSSEANKQFNSYAPLMRDAWVAGRLLGRASLHPDGTINICPGAEGDEGEMQFYGHRNLYRRNITANTGRMRSHVSCLIPGYEALLQYLNACETGDRLAQKFGILRYPLPNLLQNLGDCKVMADLNSLIDRMRSLGVIPYDQEGDEPSYDEIDLEKFAAWVEQTELTLSSNLGIPHALLFQRSPKGSTSGRFEIGNWVSKLRWEIVPFLAEWSKLAKVLGVNPTAQVNFSTMLDLYVNKDVSQIKESG